MCFVSMSFRCVDKMNLREREFIIHSQVTDIADAMILRRLLETLLNHGVVIVMTSKSVLTIYFPSSLFTNHLQPTS